ncbi:MAG: thiamine-phosphate kinase, partial [Actinobacteria bacterium]|nr:thiamine-phosphate kinase [Actinomycetota bacterium]
MRLSDTGELGLLHELESRGLIEGTEHDAAELGDGLVVTQDALVEGVHFTFDRLTWSELGFRAAAVNISDLSASAARPDALVVTLGLPGHTEVADVVELYEGIAEAGVPVRGGDTTRAETAFLSVTALGRSERVPGRAGAR